jgi:hypothetical protein
MLVWTSVGAFASDPGEFNRRLEIMELKMNYRLGVALAALAAIGLAGAAFAQSTITNVTSTLSASPRVYRGVCPGVITFNGTITVVGRINPRQPVQIGYTFLRSDGATGPISYYTIVRPGTQTVSTTWTLGGRQLPHYSGWEQLKAWPTSHLGFGYSFSPKAEFRLICMR